MDATQAVYRNQILDCLSEGKLDEAIELIAKLPSIDRAYFLDIWRKRCGTDLIH